MVDRDARILHSQAQEELRRRAIKMLKQGHTQQAVADTLDVTQQAVGKRWEKYKGGGLTAVKRQKRGRREGDNRFLTPEQESAINKPGKMHRMPPTLRYSTRGKSTGYQKPFLMSNNRCVCEIGG